MHYKFNNAVHLNGKDYTQGVHEVPEDAENHRDFLHFVDAGYITDVDAVREVVVQETPRERSARLHARILAKKVAPVAAPVKAKTGPSIDELKAKAEAEAKARAEADAEIEVDSDVEERAAKAVPLDEDVKEDPAAKAAKPHHAKRR